MKTESTDKRARVRDRGDISGSYGEYGAFGALFGRVVPLLRPAGFYEDTLGIRTTAEGIPEAMASTPKSRERS